MSHARKHTICHPPSASGACTARSKQVQRHLRADLLALRRFLPSLGFLFDELELLVKVAAWVYFTYVCVRVVYSQAHPRDPSSLNFGQRHTHPS